MSRLSVTSPDPEETPRDISDLPELALITGLPDDRRATLEPGHDLFGTFADAYRRQDAESRSEHRARWSFGIKLWPLEEGRPRSRDRRANAIRTAAVRQQTDPSTAADRLRLPVDSTRRTGALAGAQDLLDQRKLDGLRFAADRALLSATGKRLDRIRTLLGQIDREGLSAAERLSLCRPDATRLGIEADLPPGLLHVGVYEYELPRIYVPGLDPIPDPHAPINLPPEALPESDAETDQLEAALSALS